MKYPHCVEYGGGVINRDWNNRHRVFLYDLYLKSIIRIKTVCDKSRVIFIKKVVM